MNGSAELKAHAPKALRMKKEAGPEAQVPEHRTPHGGQVQEGQVDYSDSDISKEPTWTPNLKRSHVARSGDGS